MIKRDLRKELSACYNPKAGRVDVLQIPGFSVFMLDGAGNPNTTPAFQEATSALYSLSYTLKFAVKASLQIDYPVLPLEGLWWTPDMSTFSLEKKDEWLWSLFIVQPDFVTSEMVEDARSQAMKKRPNPFLADIRFTVYDEGLCAQTMHLGLYAAEAPTMQMLHQYIIDNGFAFNGKHHEIYLSDPRRTAPEKIKTILRQPIRRLE